MEGNNNRIIMRIVYFSATKLGLACCRHILENHLGEIVGIVTIPEEFSISYSKKKVKNVQYADFLGFANENGIPLLEVEGRMAEHCSNRE